MPQETIHRIYAMHCHLGTIFFMSILCVTHPATGGSSIKAAVHKACQNMFTKSRAEQIQKGPIWNGCFMGGKDCLENFLQHCV